MRKFRFNSDRLGAQAGRFMLTGMTLLCAAAQAQQGYAPDEATLSLPGCNAPVIVNAGQKGYYRTLYSPEQFRVLYLDKKNQLILDEIQNRGTVDHAPVYPREVVRRALELSSSALILVHNHPTRSKRSRWSTHKHAETLGKLGTFAIA